MTATRILYLARFAPNFRHAKPLPDPSFGVASIYHWEIFKVLEGLQIEVIPSRDLDDLFSLAEHVDYVFTLFNRTPFRGSEVFVSSVCEYLGLPYLGAPPHIRSVAEDKHLTKLIARSLGIPTPKWTIYRADERPRLPPPFPGPYFVKRRFGAGSHGIDEASRKDDWHALRHKIDELQTSGYDALVEQFVAGKNVTLPIIGSREPWLLPAVENVSSAKDNILTNAHKRGFDTGLTRRLLEDERRVAESQQYGLRLAQELSPFDYIRIDFRAPTTHDQPLQLLEFNVCCNLGSHSSIVFPAKEVGVSQSGLVAKILSLSFERQNVRWQSL